ncbi:MAG: Hsp70 family protein, partial [Parvularculaceae bacterium]|nr:Hsp70 family protein [Parvularculaceae bacterium]
GVPQVEVTFDIDANGIVHVSAKDKATNKEQSIRIQASGGLSDDDIDQMVKDAESHAEEDSARRARVEAKNSAESTIHQTEKALADFGDKVSAEEKTAIEDAIATLKATVEDENADAEKLTADTQALLQASMKLGEAMYKAQQADSGEDGGAEAPSDAGDDSVVDADFEEVDGDKKE